MGLLGQTINQMIVEHAPYGHSSEVAWMLWAALTFKIGLSPKAVTAVAGLQDSFVALLALDAELRGLAPGLDSSLWLPHMTTDGLDGDMWLLSYEAGVRL